MRLPLKESIEQIKQAYTEEQKENLFKLWLARYPNYTKDNFETFEEFYNKSMPKEVQYDTRNKDEIMKEILNRKG